MRNGLAIGIDAGGTKVAGLLVDCSSGGRVLARAKAEMPAGDADRAVETTIAVGRELAGRPEASDGVGAVGIGAAGMIDLDGVMRFAPNIAWRDVALGPLVADALDIVAYADNDANVAAWGEFRFGAGRGSNDMLLVTVGTGIGGGIVAGGRLFRGAHGFGAEIGHIIVEPDGPLCGCGNHGCWEQVASGRAIDRLGRAAALEHPDSILASLNGGDTAAVRGTQVTEAARRGDRAALDVFEEVGRRLGEGIAGLVNVLDPDVVVVGGGAVVAGDLLLGPARRAFGGTVEAPGHRPAVPMVPAALGTDAGAIGAADLALLRARSGDVAVTNGGP